jgi:TetR/AcrR family tetracycline transcriptional repressor
MPNSRRRPGHRAAITAESVARAALATVERDGLDYLSMRRVAEELGVQAATLYWHVQSKEHLLDLMADALLADFQLPQLPDNAGWRAALGEMVYAYYRFLLNHRDSGRIIAGRFAPGPHFVEHVEAFAAQLRRSGLPDRDAAYALYAVVVYVQGFVLHQTSPLSGDSAAGAVDRDVLAQIRDQLLALPVDRYPATTALAEPLTRPDIEQRFVFGFELLLDGISARLSGTS